VANRRSEGGGDPKPRFSLPVRPVGCISTPGLVSWNKARSTVVLAPFHVRLEVDRACRLEAIAGLRQRDRCSPNGASLPHRVHQNGTSWTTKEARRTGAEWTAVASRRAPRGLGWTQSRAAVGFLRVRNGPGGIQRTAGRSWATHPRAIWEIRCRLFCPLCWAATRRKVAPKWERRKFISETSGFDFQTAKGCSAARQWARVRVGEEAIERVDRAVFQGEYDENMEELEADLRAIWRSWAVHKHELRYPSA
jgi:hypothetical protein